MAVDLASLSLFLCVVNKHLSKDSMPVNRLSLKGYSVKRKDQPIESFTEAIDTLFASIWENAKINFSAPDFLRV